MQKFIFYTMEGFTESPTNKSVENMQILGFESGKDCADALKNLLKNNPWIMALDFCVDKILNKRLADECIL